MLAMKAKLLDKSQGKNLYEQVADRIRSLIANGTLQPGDRLPSVRKLHQQLSVSISTVLEAYRLLEDEGMISARPQSGYYVKQAPFILPEEPTPSNPPGQVCAVDTYVASRVCADIRNPKTIKLGAAVPSPDLFPVAALNRLMGQVIRAQPEIVHAYDVSLEILWRLNLPVTLYCFKPWNHCTSRHWNCLLIPEKEFP